MTKVGEIKKPWERWPDETDTAYDRFVMYLKMGADRSISKVADKLQKGSSYATHLRRWSSKYDWVDRAAAYDEHLVLKSLRNKERIMDMAHARLWKMVGQALDTYEEILILDNVIYVGEGSKTVINEKLKVAKDILDRLGVNFAVKEGLPPSNDSIYTQINNYLYGSNPNGDG